MKKSTRIVLALIIGTILTALSYYIVLPPLNVFSKGFWTYLLFVICFYSLPLGVARFAPAAKKNQANVKFN